jgi:hypothetical protein
MRCCCHQRMGAQMFLSARTPLVVSAFDWLHDPPTSAHLAPKSTSENAECCRPRAVPCTFCQPLDAQYPLTSRCQPRRHWRRPILPSPPPFPLHERAPRVTSRDSMSSPNNVPSMVTCSALHCPDGFSAHLALHLSHSAWLSPC